MIRHGEWPDKKGVFHISAWARECNGANCDTDTWSTFDNVNDPDLYFGTTKAAKNKKAMCVGYDRANHRLVFFYGKDVRTVDAASHGLPAFANDLAPSQTWHLIETRNDVENCPSGKKSGFIDGDVDHVKVGKFYRPGDTGPGGGIVFFTNADGSHGLEAAPFPMTPMRWGCTGTEIAGADAVAIGSGAQNTADILAGCNEFSFAASLANQYSPNGYTDWYLPSRDELNEMYLQKSILGISGGKLWSSTEVNQDFAWGQWFDNGNPVNDTKNSNNFVRPIRAF